MQVSKKYVSLIACSAIFIVGVFAVPKASKAQFLPTSGSFYDFGNIFNGGDWAGQTAAIFGGNTLGDLISSTVGGSVGGVLGGLGGSGIFDQVFGEVLGQTGLPPELMDVITGRTQPRSILDDVLGTVLDNIGLSGDLEGLLGDILGASGIPAIEPLLDELYSDTQADNQSIYGQPPNTTDVLGTPPEHVTANVIPSLIRPTQALAALTEAVTAVGLSMEGQELTEARRVAGNTVVGASEEMGSLSTVLAEQQVQAAAALSPVIQSQTSTQDTLKQALAGMAQLDAQATQFYALANEQQALGLQLNMLHLDTAVENRDGSLAIATGLQHLNEQIFAERQVEITSESSARIGMSLPLRTMGAVR